jgi:hypothetical protein
MHHDDKVISMCLVLHLKKYKMDVHEILQLYGGGGLLRAITVFHFHV